MLKRVDLSFANEAWLEESGARGLLRRVVLGPSTVEVKFSHL